MSRQSVYTKPPVVVTIPRPRNHLFHRDKQVGCCVDERLQPHNPRRSWASCGQNPLTQCADQITELRDIARAIIKEFGGEFVKL
jgi:hypothetical protein